MKKTNTLLSAMTMAFFFLFSTAMTQSLQVFSTDGNDVSGSVVNMWGDSGIATTIYADFDVKNISSGSISVKVKKVEVSLQSGTTNLFCFAGHCYLSTVYISQYAANINAGEKDTTFSGEYKPKGHLGASTIMYVFFNTNDANDSAFVIVQYNATPADINQFNNTVFEISSPYPNPATSQVSFDYNLPENSSASFTLSDITGSTIKEIPVYGTHGNLNVPVNDISEGMYFYSFYLNGKMILTKKLIIQK